MHEYYAQKTEKLIMQLHHATHGERRNTAKYPNIS